LVGQATWYDLVQIGVTCVIRGDIDTRNYVKLPNTLAPFQSGAAGDHLTETCRGNSIFQGNFFVQRVRHVGRFRLSDAEA
jgi:hypothetical protein